MGYEFLLFDRTEYQVTFIWGKTMVKRLYSYHIYSPLNNTRREIFIFLQNHVRLNKKCRC